VTIIRYPYHIRRGERQNRRRQNTGIDDISTADSNPSRPPLDKFTANLESVATSTFAEGVNGSDRRRRYEQFTSQLLPTTPRIPLVPNNLGISDLLTDIIISRFNKTSYRTGATFINSF